MTYVQRGGTVTHTASVDADRPLLVTARDGEPRRFLPTQVTVERVYHPSQGWLRRITVAVCGPRTRRDGSPYTDRSRETLAWRRLVDGTWSAATDHTEPMPTWLAAWVGEQIPAHEVPANVADIAREHAKRRALR